MVDVLDVHRGAYHDSVTLMQVSAEVGRMAGVDVALLAMATPLNLELFVDLGFDTTGLGALVPTDLVVAVRAEGPDAASAGEVEARRLLSERGGDGGSGRGPAAGRVRHRPASVAAAARNTATAVALVSVPGEHAFAEAMDALEAGLHVVVFSDNVGVHEEIALKDRAAQRDLLALGPDCGTVILGGVGLGFANVVLPGPVSLVAASGTGAQQVCALLDAAGVGVRHVLGVGGRDLTAEVGGRATRAALRVLDDDPATEVIGLVAKSVDATVGERMAELSSTLATPVVPMAADRPGDDLTAGTDRVLDVLGVAAPNPRRWPADHSGVTPGALRALYCGGTLCQEALGIAAADIDPGLIATNLGGGTVDRAGPGHLFVDFGDDELTVGRPHPMIDGRLRIEQFLADANRPDVSVILADVVLGHAAHPHPADDLAPAISAALRTAAAAGRHLAVVVTLVGTRSDPQGLELVAGELAAAGADVHLSNAAASRHAVRLAVAGGR